MNKTAIALKYQGSKPPSIEACAHGQLAEEILALAKELKIPLLENPELAALLAHCQEDDQVPGHLEYAVREILSLALDMQHGLLRNPNWQNQ